MANLKNWLLNEAAGEDIEAVVIGQKGGVCFSFETDLVPRDMQERILSWDEASPLLDYAFDNSYGSAGCSAVYAWTATRVIAISTYDGSTGVYSIPRNPAAVLPQMVGGG